MNDFIQYSELYHHGVKGMHWGIRKKSYSKTSTKKGKKKKSIGEAANEAVDKVMGIDNKYLNKVLKTSAKLRLQYSKMSRMKSDAQLARSAQRAQKLADQYFKQYGKKPLSYNQYQRAKVGAVGGAVLGVAVPVVIPLWASIPAGYYIGAYAGGGKKHKG